MPWINLFGLLIIVLMLLPNMIYAYKNKNAENKCTNKAINIAEQIGRYGSMFLMVFNIGIAELGFKSMSAFVFWLIAMVVLLLSYWIVWIFYFKVPKMHFALPLAIIPSAIFILSGFICRHWLLVVFGAVFSIAHTYVTYQNNRTQ